MYKIWSAVRTILIIPLFVSFVALSTLISFCNGSANVANAFDFGSAIVADINNFNLDVVMNEGCAVNNNDAVTLFYYNQLNAQAKKFYNAIAVMRESGGLREVGGVYDCIASGVVSVEQVRQFALGNTELLYAFSAAKLAFNLDNPNVFYVDFSKLSLSMFRQGNAFVARIDAGNDDSFLADGFNDAADVLLELNDGVSGSYSSIIADLKPTAQQTYLQIKEANANIASSVQPGYTASLSGGGSAFHAGSSLGAANGVATSEGFSKLFKAVMDEMGIPCIVVRGYKAAGGGFSPYAINMIYFEGNWFCVDTFASSKILSDGGNPDQCAFIGSEIYDYFIPDSGAWGSGVNFSYPAVAEFNYDEGAIDCSYTFNPINETIKITFAYNGKSAQVLESENSATYSNLDKHFVICYNSESEDYFSASADSNVGRARAQSVLSIATFCDYQTYSTIEIDATQIATFEIFLTATVADEANGFYSERPLVSQSFLTGNRLSSGVVENDLLTSNRPAFGNLVVIDNLAYTQAAISSAKTSNVKITFDHALELPSGKTEDDILLSFTSNYGNDLTDFFDISNINFDGDKTLSFNVFPRALFYRYATPVFVSTKNLISTTGGAVYPLSVIFEPQDINLMSHLDGNLISYTNTASILNLNCADISGWTCFNGQEVMIISEHYIDFLTLKLSSVSAENQLEMCDSAGVALASFAQAYDISLTFEGFEVSVESGSSITLALPYPNGNADKDYVIYHFYEDNRATDFSHFNTISPVKTNYGLVFEIDSFSPILIAERDSESAFKSVFALSINEGGSVSIRGNTSHSTIKSLAPGESVSFEIALDADYALDFCLLNGEEVNISGGFITLFYNQLEDANTLEISFIQQTLKDSHEADGLVNLFKENLALASSYSPEVPTSNSNTIVILAIVAAIILVAAAMVTIIIVRNKRAIGVR